MSSKSFHICAVVILSIVTLVPIWATEYFPSQNGPWFMLSAHVFRELDNPEFNYDEFYRRNWHPIPHLLHDFAVAGLAYVFPQLISEKIVLSVFCLLMPYSIYALLRAVSPRGTPLAYFGFLMVHTFSFYRGYHDFTLSIPLLFLCLAYWYPRRENLTMIDRLVLTLFVVSIYLSHVVSLLLVSCVMGWIRLFETKDFLRSTLHVALVTIVGWLLVADYAMLNKQNTWMSNELVFLKVHVAAEYLFMKFFFTMSEPAYYIASALSLGVIGMVVYGLFANREKTLLQKIGDPWIALALFLFVAYFCLPYKIVQWHKANTRLIPFVFGFAIIGAARLMRDEWVEKIQKWLSGAMVVGMIAIVGFTTVEIYKSVTVLNDYVSGIEHFEQNATLLPVHLDNPVWGQVRPLTRAHEYYHMAKGGANGFGIGRMNTLSMAWYKDYPVQKRFPVLEEVHADLNIKELVSYLPKYDFVLVWGGKPEEITALDETSELKLVHHQGGLRLFKVQVKSD